MPSPLAAHAGIERIDRAPGLDGVVRAWFGIVLGALGTALVALFIGMAVAS